MWETFPVSQIGGHIESAGGVALFVADRNVCPAVAKFGLIGPAAPTDEAATGDPRRNYTPSHGWFITLNSR